jgi:hypothetical protein
MGKTVVLAVVAVLAGFASSAGPAGARDAQRQVVAFSVQNLGDASAACPDALFGLSFDMVGPGGSALGTGRSCVRSLTGCEFAAGCKARVRATFVLDLACGSITARMALRETWSTDALVIQRGEGSIVSGTGAFAGARGSVEGAGVIEFGETGASPLLVYVVRVRRGACP